MKNSTPPRGNILSEDLLFIIIFFLNFSQKKKKKKNYVSELTLLALLLLNYNAFHPFVVFNLIIIIFYLKEKEAQIK